MQRGTQSRSRRAYIPLNPKPTSVWARYHCQLAQLSERVAALSATGPALPPLPADINPEQTHRHALGWRGEAELAHLIAQNENLSLFHGKPDDEFAEYAVLHLTSGYRGR